jgi:uncharacterized membrane protein
MSKNVKYVVLISILFALFDKVWFKVPFASQIYNNTVSKIQGSEIDPTDKKIYGVIAYLIMGLVYYKLIYPSLESEEWQEKSIYYSLAVWGVFNLTNIVIFKNYTKEMLLIDIGWGLLVTQIIGYILKKKKLINL